MTTATRETTDIELNELVAAYRSCQEQVKAWEDEKAHRVRPALEQKMAERGASIWECSYGKALYIDAKGQVDWEAAFTALLSAQTEGLPEADRVRLLAHWSHELEDAYRKPAQRRFEVRPPLKIFSGGMARIAPSRNGEE